jgi:hypothetical protein
MINQSIKRIAMKRKLLALLAALPFLAACTAVSGETSNGSEDEKLRWKFRGLWGVVLRIDAATRKEGVTITSQTGKRIGSPASLSLENVSNQTYTDNSMPIPKTIRAVWRDKPKAVRGKHGGLDYEGMILGDYTVPVAQRIPDDILDYIRNNGGALRLKIRLKDNGILIGWDVEKIVPYKGWKPGDGPTGIHYLMPGGDFREAQVYNGKVTDPGWQK